MKSFAGALRGWFHWLWSHIKRALTQRWFNLGLRGKMSAMVIVGLGGLLTVFGFLGISTTRQATRQVLSERVTMARLSAATIDSSLRQIESVLHLARNTAELRDPQAPLADRQKVLQASFEEIKHFSHGLFLLDRDGVLLVSICEEELYIDWLSIPAVKEVLTRRLTSAQLSTLPGDQPQAAVVLPIYDQTGGPSGALVTLLDFSSPSPFPFERPFNLGETGTFDVIDSNGVVLLSSQPGNVLRANDLKKFLSRLFIAGAPMVETCLGCYGEGDPDAGDEVIAFAPLTEAPWGVVVRQKAAEAFAPVRRLMIQILILSLATVAGALGLVWVTTSSVIEPVQILTAAAKRIAEGDLDTPLKLPSKASNRNDEIGALERSFSRMRERLKQSIEEIKAWNQELDNRVKERTLALNRSRSEAQAARDDLKAVIDSLSDELVVIDVKDRKVQQMNRTARLLHPELGQTEPVFCYQLEDGTGPCEAKSHDCPINLVLSTGETARITHITEIPGQGRPIYTEITASPMRDADGTITRIVELKRDVTEEVELRESLLRRNQQLAIINAVANTVNQSLNLEDILSRALDEVLRLTEIDIGAIFLQDETSGDLRLMAYRGLSEEAALNASKFGLVDSSCGGILESGQVLIVPDLSRLHTRRARRLQKEPLSTLVHVPLTAKGFTLGSLCIGTRQKREFGDQEQELLNAIGNQIAVAIENARLYAEVQHKEQVRGELFKKAINAQEEERKRIARELHDDTSQSLAALLFAAEEGMEIKEPREVGQRLERIRDLAQRTLDGVHKIIFDLRPSMLDHLGLVPALRWLANSRLEAKGIRVFIEEDCDTHRLPSEVETAIFRVVQEAITNIARHSGARNVSILFRFNHESAHVTVEDDGIGFNLEDLEVFPDTARGLGLLSMQERVELLGGDLEVESNPGAGTRIYIRVPLSERKSIYA